MDLFFWKIVSESLQNYAAELQILKINFCDLNFSKFSLLKNSISYHPNLKMLDLGNNQLEPKCMELISVIVKA